MNHPFNNGSKHQKMRQRIMRGLIVRAYKRASDTDSKAKPEPLQGATV